MYVFVLCCAVLVLCCAVLLLPPQHQVQRLGMAAWLSDGNTTGTNSSGSVSDGMRKGGDSLVWESIGLRVEGV